MAFFAEIKIETVLTFESHSNYWHFLASVTFDKLFYLLTRLNNQLYSMSKGIMSTNLQLVIVKLSGKITILTNAEIITTCTNKTRSNNWPHIATYTFILIMSS